MNKFLAAAAVLVASLTLLAPQAQAGHKYPIGYSSVYLSGHASCGCPLHTRRVCYGYDRSQRPLFHYFRQPFRCGCKDSSKHYKKLRKAQEKYRKEQEKHFKKYHQKHKKPKKGH